MAEKENISWISHTPKKWRAKVDLEGGGHTLEKQLFVG
jgi:hypothetical protein